MYNDETASLRASFHANPVHFGYERHGLNLPPQYSDATFARCNKPPTPPPDMHDNLRNGGYYYEPGQSSYTSGVTSQPSTFSTVRDSSFTTGTSSRPNTFSISRDSQEQGRNGTSDLALSPNTFGRSFANHDTGSEPSVSRRSSQANVIAPSFQIPKTVNDSGGSLSELAAEITCLFWFESSELLQQIEQTPQSIIPARPLAKDAIPTTGFKKWVTTILSTTLVGANVVLLALLFVHRLKGLNPAVKGKPGSEYRLLTVALMLGNKFLDDNTYTNKTWAEVSGINVSEVHIMEVEFLSNMKYCLYTSLEQWNEWQTLLGRYAQYFTRAMSPIPARTTIPPPILPPASSIRLPMALPSPPSSIQASPPYSACNNTGSLGGSGTSVPYGVTPAPSPLTPFPAISHEPVSRKRSRDDSVGEPPAKRLASVAHRPGELPAGHLLHAQRPSIPKLPPPISQAMQMPPMTHTSQAQQLPPMSVPARAMGLVYPSTGQSTSSSFHTPSVAQSQPSSRQHSPYWRNDDTPRQDMSASSSFLQPLDISPSSYLQQRNSPYRPVHNVSTLLYPPPSAALQPRQPNIEYSQMHYQPLGKASQLQSGRLPHVGTNSWLDGLAPLKPWTQPPNGPFRHPLSFQQS